MSKKEWCDEDDDVEDEVAAGPRQHEVDNDDVTSEASSLHEDIKEMNQVLKEPMPHPSDVLKRELVDIDRDDDDDDDVPRHKKSSNAAVDDFGFDFNSFVS